MLYRLVMEEKDSLEEYTIFRSDSLDAIKFQRDILLRTLLFLDKEDSVWVGIVDEKGAVIHMS